MKSSWALVILAALLAAVGVWLSGQLLAKHVKAPGVPEWLHDMCESGEDGNVSCDAVLSSKWGMWPIAKEGDPEDTPRTPVALIGMEYFTGLLAWLLFVGRPNRRGRFWHLVPLIVSAAGIAGSVFFIYIMATELKTWCPLCLATHVINALLFVVLVLLWPRAPKKSGEAKSKEQSPPELPARYPTARLAVTAIFLAMVLAQLQLQTVSTAALQRTNQQLTAAIEEVQGNVQSMIAMHLNNEQMKIDIRPDDPVRYNAERLPIIVVFSDFECSSCRKFAESFEEKIREFFGGFIRIVYKHYPLNSDCNEHVARRAHANACHAAELAEAVRLVGGNDKFWQAHDLFFADQKALSSMTPEKLADTLGLSAADVANAAKSEMVQQRIAEDIALARKLGVTSTPTVYLNHREVNSWARGVDGFWQKLGAMYQMQRLREAAKQQLQNSSNGT